MNRYTGPAVRFFERATLLVERALGQDRDANIETVETYGTNLAEISTLSTQYQTIPSIKRYHGNPWRLIVSDYHQWMVSSIFRDTSQGWVAEWLQEAWDIALDFKNTSAEQAEGGGGSPRRQLTDAGSMELDRWVWWRIDENRMNVSIQEGLYWPEEWYMPPYSC